MQDLYITILELNEDGLTELAYEKLDLTHNKYTFQGLKFKILCEHGDYLQVLVYAYNDYTTQVLGDVDDLGIRYGMKYDVPILFETESGFVNVLCDYIVQISKKPIDKYQMLQKLGVNSNWRLSQESYNHLLQLFYESERITGFQEMCDYIRTNENLYNETVKMAKRTRVYGEHFVSTKNVSNEGKIEFQENLTLIVAEQFVKLGKHVAVLNFANPVEEGGGILRGATSQEEYLCRSSNLYYSLISKNAIRYYDSNRNILKQNQFNSMFLGTDSVIYSPNVLILKETVRYRPGFIGNFLEKYCDHKYNVDVVTCSAPFFSGSDFILPNGDLIHLFECRIRNIFETCIENDVEVLILGAFGCGAFHNPPNIVADSFRNVLLEKRYKNAFDQVVFAIKRNDTICSNIEAFERSFSSFPNINNNGTEKKNRLLWKWKCKCGFENHWDNMQCTICGRLRKYRESVVCYN